MHIADHIRYWARNRPDVAAAIFDDGTALTWRQLDDGSDRIAAGLLLRGLVAGDRVSVLLDAHPAFVELAAACIKAGLILSPLNIRLTGPELLHQLRDAGSRLVVTSAALGPGLATAQQALPELDICCTDGQTGPGYETLRARHATALRAFAPDDGLFLCYTSGTTGLPKAALLTHHGVRAAGLSKQISDGITCHDRVLSLAPLCLTAGLVTNLTQITFLVGATILLESRFDPERALQRIVREQVTTMAMVPLMLDRMSQLPAFARADLGRLQHVTTGGPDLTQALIGRYRERGVSLDPSFGQTEASSVVTWSRRSEMGDRFAASGRPIMHTEIRIADDEDRELAVGDAGEILVRGPGVMHGYWNRPEQTAETLRNGWLHTGDVGYVDEAGYLFVCDRKKDMYRSGGLNVYPTEVEQAILPALPSGTDLAVIGLPDTRWGEIGLLVIGNNAAIDADALKAHMQQQLAAYKHPKQLVVIEGPLPRNATGKIRKVELRDRFKAHPDDITPLGTAPGNADTSY